MRAKGVDVTDVAPDIACFGMDGWMDGFGKVCRRDLVTAWNLEVDRLCLVHLSYIHPLGSGWQNGRRTGIGKEGFCGRFHKILVQINRTHRFNDPKTRRRLEA